MLGAESREKMEVPVVVVSKIDNLGCDAFAKRRQAAETGRKSMSKTATMGPVTGLPTKDARLGPLTDGHHVHECRHLDDMQWEVQRFAGIESKMLFHPRPERPTEPNAGILRYAPGSGHPVHSHHFAQVWYILEGEFDIGAKVRARHNGFSPRSTRRTTPPHQDRRPNPVRAVSGADYWETANLRWPVQSREACRSRERAARLLSSELRAGSATAASTLRARGHSRFVSSQRIISSPERLM